MRALVTGGHGFIGTHLVRRLLDEGAAVRCLYRRPGRPAALEGLGVEIAPGDIRSPGGLQEAFRGVDEAYHIAGVTSSLTQRAMRATNAEGTRNLLEAAARADFRGRFLHCSSLAVGGPALGKEPPDEHAPPRPVTWYGASKLEAERHALDAPHPFPVTVVRPPAVYGPGDMAFLPIFTAASRGLAILPGSPAKRYSFIYAQDLAAAFIAAARAPGTIGGAFYAAHPEIVTLEQVIAAAEHAVDRRARRLGLPASLMRLVGQATDLVSQITGRSSVLGSQRMREVAEGDWICSPRALEAAAGWRAQVPLLEGFRLAADWYRAQGHLR